MYGFPVMYVREVLHEEQTTLVEYGLDDEAYGRSPPTSIHP